MKLELLKPGIAAVMLLCPAWQAFAEDGSPAPVPAVDRERLAGLVHTAVNKVRGYPRSLGGVVHGTATKGLPIIPQLISR